MTSLQNLLALVGILRHHEGLPASIAVANDKSLDDQVRAGAVRSTGDIASAYRGADRPPRSKLRLLDEARESIAAALRDDLPVIRRAAIRAPAAVRDDSVEATLIDMMQNDPAPNNRGWAAWCLQTREPAWVRDSEYAAHAHRRQ